MIDPAEKADIARLERQLEGIQQQLNDLYACQLLASEWFTLRQAARLKRGVEIRKGQTFESFYRTLCARPWLRPAAGIPDAKIGGAAVWHRDTIRIWLRITDGELEAIRKAS